MTLPSRRSVLHGAGVLAAVGALGLPAAAAAPRPDGGGPFRHGVASGDPLPDGVLLWTRVTPTDDALPGSGVGPDVTLDWEVAQDSRFRKVVARGRAATGAWRDHTVSVDVAGLAPATTYWYRFRLGRQASPVGRTRTAPAVGAGAARLRMGVLSCANWQAGHFAAYRHLAARDDLDVVLHLGDYLYEYAPGEYQAGDVVVRPHEPAREMTTLADYRQRHAQYKTDPDLQALHAAAPWVVTWDDHESANDAHRDGAENHTEGAEGTWSQRQAFSQQAYAEWMPVRYRAGGRLYRSLAFGSLMSLSMLDLRTYRELGTSITGAAQMSWLLDRLSDRSVQWKVVGNPVMITPVRFPSTLSTQELQALHELTGTPPVDGAPYNTDQWDGYTDDRATVLRHLRDNGIRDTTFLTGDIHSAWACDIPVDPLTYPSTGDSVATELVGTSVTSDNVDDILGVPPRTASLAVEAAVRANNPHIKHLELDSHGYSVVEVTPARLQMDWYALSDRTDPQATSTHVASYEVAAGTQKVRPAGEALR